MHKSTKRIEKNRTSFSNFVPIAKKFSDFEKEIIKTTLKTQDFIY
nr:MAG TPA: hypothetical protein [Caudoviricetes sp.]